MAKTVLVVDDDPEFTQMVDDILSAEGHTVVQCTDPREAGRRARLSKPDEVIVDLSMPDVGGWQVVAQIRGDPAVSNAHIVVCTASPKAADYPQEKLSAFGCDLLLKPFELNDLRHLIDKS